MKSLFPISVELILILRPASLALGRVLILDCHPELQWVRRYARNSSYRMLQKITYGYSQHHSPSSTHCMSSCNGKRQSTLFIFALPDLLALDRIGLHKECRTLFEVEVETVKPSQINSRKTKIRCGRLR